MRNPEELAKELTGSERRFSTSRQRMSPMIQAWKKSLGEVHSFYEENKPSAERLLPWLFGFFVLVNGLSYWGASLTAFPETIFNNAVYYFKVQFPVAILGAVFDSLSFFITMRMIRNAIQSTSVAKFVGYLLVDVVIAIVATFWVLFVFSFSSWLIRLTESSEVAVELGARQHVYQERLQEALRNPWSSKRNIYFGLVMGASAMLPTCFHLYAAAKSMFRIESELLERVEGRISGWLAEKMTKLG